MKTVVITGSTRGIGRGLAENFHKRGCNVVISGRNQAQVDALVAELGDRAAGIACDITSESQLNALWQCAADAFGTVDVWINNAGVGIKRGPLDEQTEEDLRMIVDINLTGALLSSKVAFAGMKAQGSGQIWNMEGFGSDGSSQPGMTAYGSTKRGVNYMIKALRKDAKETGVQICTLSPGIVVTELLVGDYDTSTPEWTKARKIFNILGDTVDTVTPWLVDKVLASDKDGAAVKWLTPGKAFGRFMTAGFKKRDLFAPLGV